MTNYNDSRGRDNRVILAGIILALQIIGLLWLLLFGRDQLAALTGQDQTTARASETKAVAEATSPPAATDSPVATTEENTTEAEATVPPTAVPNAAASTTIGPEEVQIESSAVAPEWLATLIEGSPGDAAAGRPPMPPHLLLTFVGPEGEIDGTAALDEIDLNRPQVRIIPIAALLSLLEQNGDQAGQQALQELLMLLDEQPDADQASVPVPPVLGDATQNFVSRTAYTPFGGGSGVGYLTNITGDDVLPVTNESGLNYVYQGVTDDGQQYVFMSWPMDAAFLPNDQAGATSQSEMLAADRVNYYETMREEVDTATESEMTPSLLALHEMIRSLSIGGLTAPVEDEPLSATAFDAVGFNWQWTAATDATGAETAVENPQDFSLVLWPDGTYSIKADCNVGGGIYTYEADGGIRLAPGPLSLALCSEDSRDTEFISSLLDARTIAFDESGDMLLSLEDGGSMTLANMGPVEGDGAVEADDQPAAADAGLAGITLQWPGYTDATGTVVTVDNPKDYILTLLPDGTFNVVADCNVGGGAYTFGDDGKLQFGPLRLTKMACPDGSRGSDFVAFLENVSGAAVESDGGVTLATGDGRSATFANLGEVGTSNVGTSNVGTSAGSADETATQPTLTSDPLNVVWQWTNFTPVGGAVTPVGRPELYTLALLDDGTYTFRADCNSGTGSYTLDGTSLTLAPGAMTLAACGADSLSDGFIDRLSQVRSIGFDEDGNLVLTPDNGDALTFADGGPFTASESGESALATTNPLADTVWQWTHFRDMKQDFNVTGTYTIAFQADGTAAVVADCNSGSGTYQIMGDAGLNISIQALTAACPPGSLGQSFVENLNFAGLYFVNGGVLTIELMADGGTMTFTPLQ